MPDLARRTPNPSRVTMPLVITAAVGLSACARSPAPEPLVTPAAAGAMLPRLSADPSGTLWLSWVEPGPGAHTLRFASLGDNAWSGALTAARGADWFVNWADFPSVVHFGEGRLAAHWLRKVEGGTYAYELLASVSSDGGAQWSEPMAPHGDATATEHGFASLFPVPGGAGAVWLDGRNTSGGDHGDGHHSAHGAMTLRAGGLD